MADTPRVIVPVELKFDRITANQVNKEISAASKKFQKINVEFKKLSTAAIANIGEIKDIATAADRLSFALSSGTKKAMASYAATVDKLETAQKRVQEINEEMDDTSTGEERKKELGNELEKLVSSISGLSKQADKLRKEHKKEEKSLKKTLALQSKYQKSVKSIADHTKEAAGSEALSGAGAFASGDVGGLGKILATSVKLGFSPIAEKLEEMRAGGSKGAERAIGGIGKAISIGKGAAGVAEVIWKLFSRASGAMAELNKALTDGVGLASELGRSSDAYAKSVNNIVNSAVSANAELLKYGLNSDKALELSNRFIKTAGGSMGRFESQLEKIGKGHLNVGLLEFSKQAQMYGRALGMEATEVADTLGTLTSNIGMNAESSLAVMHDVVQQAAASNIPLGKFTEIFREVAPNLDLFANRIEEVTGTIKLMSKTMDPRSIKNFMNAMGRGFDQMDFRQRLKMALVIGQPETKKIMEKDIGQIKKSFIKNFPELQKEFEEAMNDKSGQGLTKMAARVSQRGGDNSGAIVKQLTDLNRYQKLASSKDVLKNASAMSYMGLRGRMDALEKYAGKFTQGDISGIGEQVASTLGVSGDLYKAVVDAQNSSEVQMTALKQSGFTGSKSINDSLAKLYEEEIKANNGDFQKTMIEQARKSPERMKEALKDAATVQIDEDMKMKEDAKKNASTIEEIMIEQVKLTTGIADQLENVINALLQKMNYVLNSILDKTGGIYGLFAKLNPSNDYIDQSASQFMNILDSQKNVSNEAKKEYVESIQEIAKIAKASGDTQEARRGLFKYVESALNPRTSDGKVDADKLNDSLRVFGADAGKFKEALEKGDAKTTEEMLNKLDKSGIAFLANQGAKFDALGKKKTPIGTDLKTEKQLEAEAKAKKEAEHGSGDETRYKELSLDDKLTKFVGASFADKFRKRLEKAIGITGSSDTSGTSGEEFGPPRPPGEEFGPPRPPGDDGTEPTPEVAKTSGEQAKVTADSTVSIAEITEQQYDKISDLYKLINKGIRLDSTFLGGLYKKTMIESIEKGAERPLLKSILLLLKLQSDKPLQDAILKNAYNIGNNASINSLILGPGEGQSPEDLAKAAGAGVFAGGGKILSDGFIYAHGGEVIGKPDQIGGGGGSVSVGSITINATSNDPQAIAGAVRKVIYDMRNRH